MLSCSWHWGCMHPMQRTLDLCLILSLAGFDGSPEGLQDPQPRRYWLVMAKALCLRIIESNECFLLGRDGGAIFSSPNLSELCWSALGAELRWLLAPQETYIGKIYAPKLWCDWLNLPQSRKNSPLQQTDVLINVMPLLMPFLFLLHPLQYPTASG